MNREALKEYVQEIAVNAKEARVKSKEDIFQAGRNLAFFEVLGILKRYLTTYEPDADLSDFGLDAGLEGELL
ncbi:MAG: hypothetical protein LBE35_03560 [Clostridiales bacterium]|jgi:hypothetical protein|nr:hypothetical protein [Clostridiales bacterium]